MLARSIRQFAHALNADASLVNGLIAALGQKQGNEAIEAFVDYARRNGFAVSRYEAVALRYAACGEEGLR